ncbi:MULTISPECIES: replication initiation protein [Pseudomonas]|uniref:Replication initiation protein n=1 Tax=Pseudomonas juntendi TaxID=2666183 RepID=A0A7W2JNC0_9PSED|nr:MULTISPECIES: replication initiation protein [Pseudomonas]MBA6062126.1 replication initiation protein [Pseudomonas juntendi]MBA6123128.1 replication initiation protein [Pseudomonas juntendi]MBA6128771.1 replication initiation protein [Pseudomonas juntendi]MBA6140731.1 replication initiation protein [Pseudomonas monteilii]
MALRVKDTAVSARPNQRFFQEGTALNRVLQECPYLPRCSDDKTAARILPREYAVCYPYMQINREGMVSWLIFDLDHYNALIWDDAGLPPPNLIVRNRRTGGTHLYYAIIPVCTTDNARSRPINYLKAIYKAFVAALDADPNYHGGPVAKTPGHPWWQTQELHNHVYELADLAECVDLEPITPWGKGPDYEAASHSRHCMLFENLRFYAYSIVNLERDKGSYDHFVRRLTAHAHNANRFGGRGSFITDLPLSSIRSTVKSVARWTWSKYTGNSRCHRGVMELDKSLPLVERQRLAAKRTHQERHKATESKIRAACRILLQQGKPLAQAAIASLAGVTRQTVATYRHILTEARVNNVVPFNAGVLSQAARSAPTDQPETGQAGKISDVKYGANQIPAPRRRGKRRPRQLLLAFDDPP